MNALESLDQIEHATVTTFEPFRKTTKNMSICIFVIMQFIGEMYYDDLFIVIVAVIVITYMSFRIADDFYKFNFYNSIREKKNTASKKSCNACQFIRVLNTRPTNIFELFNYKFSNFLLFTCLLLRSQ